jgi:hypothetical protein
MNWEPSGCRSLFPGWQPPQQVAHTIVFHKVQRGSRSIPHYNTREGKRNAEKISLHVHRSGHEGTSHSGANGTEKVSHTEVEFKPGVQPKQSPGLHDVSDGFESARRVGNMESLGGSD